MYWREWWQSMFGRKSDWFPFAIGVLLLILSFPTFIILLTQTETEWASVVISLLVLFAVGTSVGLFFTIMGLRQSDEIRLGLLRLFRRERTQGNDDMPPAVRRFLDS